jgi:NAD(P)H dehydrogenase (quinone)
VAKVLVIVGHASRGSFCEALGQAYARGAEAGGLSATLIVTSALTFDPVLRDGYRSAQPLEPDLQAARDALSAADHVVVVFPLWFGGKPAILSNFFERLLQPELVEPLKTNAYVKLLSGKSARIVVTMKMPALVHRWFYGAYTIQVLRRNFLGFLGATPVRSTCIGSMDGLGEAGRKSWLDSMESLGRRGG